MVTLSPQATSSSIAQDRRGEGSPARTKTGDGIVFGESLVLAGEPCLVTVVRDVTEWKKSDAQVRNYRLHMEELVNERTEELRTANEKLQELDRLKSMFIASMSHKLRTLLNSIIGFTGITLRGLFGGLNDEQKDNLSRAGSCGTAMFLCLVKLEIEFTGL